MLSYHIHKKKGIPKVNYTFKDTLFPFILLKYVGERLVID